MSSSPPALLLIGVTLAAAPAPRDPASHRRETSVVDVRIDGRTTSAARQLVESRLAAWQPPSLSSLPSACFRETGDVDGFWTGGSDPGGCLYIGPGSEGRRVFEYVADSHDATLRFRRSAGLQAGQLILSGPVMDADMEPFERLHAVTNGELRWLIPDASVGEVTALVEKRGCQALAPEWVTHVVFQPASADAASYCRDILGLSPARKK